MCVVVGLLLSNVFSFTLFAWEPSELRINKTNKYKCLLRMEAQISAPTSNGMKLF